MDAAWRREQWSAGQGAFREATMDRVYGKPIKRPCV